MAVGPQVRVGRGHTGERVRGVVEVGVACYLTRCVLCSDGGVGSSQRAEIGQMSALPDERTCLRGVADLGVRVRGAVVGEARCLPVVVDGQGH